MTTTAQFLANLIKEHVGVEGELDEGYLGVFVETENLEDLGNWFLDFQSVMTNEEAENLVEYAAYYAAPHDAFMRTA